VSGIARSVRERPSYLLVAAALAALVIAILGLTLESDSPGGTYADSARPDDSGDCHSPGTACRTIGAAIAKAGHGATVHVDGGVYDESVELTDEKSLVAEDFAPPAERDTIIDGSSAAAVTVPESESAGTIEGLTLRSSGAALQLEGPAAVTGNRFDGAGNGSGGIEVTSADAGDDSVITDNLLIGGLESRYGIRVVGSPIVSANRFIRLGDPLSLGPGAANVLGNTFRRTQDGPEIAVGEGAAPSIVANLMAPVAGFGGVGNGGVGISSANGIVIDRDAAGGMLTRNRILGHDVGVLVVGGSGPVTIDSDLISGSRAAGISLATPPGATSPGADVTVASSTIFGNAVDIINAGGDLTLDSTIVGNPIKAGPGANCTITFSRGPTTSGGPCQKFQTDDPPGFNATGIENPLAYHLTIDSPLIDRGAIEAISSGSLDLDGEARNADGDCDEVPRRDIGADEFLQDCPDAEGSTTTTPSG
jgi:hypothetical protein